MADELDEEVQQVLDAIDALGSSEDEAVRAMKLTELLKQWPDTYAKVREMRQQALIRLNEGGMTYREIANLLGISHGRVSQIIAGETASYTKKRSKKADQPPTE